MSNIPYVKSYEVVGYTADADVYCPSCARECYGSVDTGAVDREGNEVGVIQADSTWDYQPTCTVCRAEIEYVTVRGEASL
jgi:hypothetical protein